MIFSASQWIFFVSVWMFIGLTQAKGSNLIRYRAVRYGNYYSSVYYSYSGGKGYARYSRVYSHATNHYPALYIYMFEWFKTDQYKVYKNTPSGSISVCKNYEANENGTYLGIFTCPLPFVPADHSYCCGLTNAQYCCKFWDVPLNFAAACIGIIMGVVVLFTFIFITSQLCIHRRKTNLEKERRNAIRRIGRLRRHGRRVTSRSIWAHALFERVHAPSYFSENSITEEDDEVDETDKRNRNIQKNVINVMKSLGKTDSHENNNDVTNASDVDENTFADESTCKITSNIRNGRKPTAGNDITAENSDCEEERHEGFTNQAFLTSWSENRDVKDASQPEYPLKPLRNSPKIKFNSDSNIKRKFSTYEFQ